MREVIYHCATTADGYVARLDGSFDCFLMEGPHADEFIASLAAYDTVLMGRKTYEVGLTMGVTDPYPFLETYVFSRTMRESPDPRVKLVNDGAVDLVKQLRAKQGKAIWVAGAGDFAASLLEAGLLDRITLKVNPVLIGEGIPLIARIAGTTRLALSGTKSYPNGVVLLEYRVERERRA